MRRKGKIRLTPDRVSSGDPVVRVSGGIIVGVLAHDRYSAYAFR